LTAKNGDERVPKNNDEARKAGRNSEIEESLEYEEFITENAENAKMTREKKNKDAPKSLEYSLEYEEFTAENAENAGRR